MAFVAETLTAIWIEKLVNSKFFQNRSRENDVVNLGCSLVATRSAQNVMHEHQEAGYSPSGRLIKFSHAVLISKHIKITAIIRSRVMDLMILTILSLRCSPGAIETLATCRRWAHSFSSDQSLYFS